MGLLGGPSLDLGEDVALTPTSAADEAAPVAAVRHSLLIFVPGLPEPRVVSCRSPQQNI